MYIDLIVIGDDDMPTGDDAMPCQWQQRKDRAPAPPLTPCSELKKQIYTSSSFLDTCV